MTLPITKSLPIHSGKIKEGGEGLDRYMRELISSLEEQYKDLAQAINGDITSSSEQAGYKYTPTINGSTLEGTGTYDRQVGWALRQGIVIDVWFNVKWTAHTGTGVLQLDLPYQAAETNVNLFTGTVFTEALAFTGIIHGIVTNGGRTMQIQESRSGNTYADISIAGAGTIRGHVRYVGKEIERD